MMTQIKQINTERREEENKSVKILYDLCHQCAIFVVRLSYDLIVSVNLSNIAILLQASLIALIGIFLTEYWHAKHALEKHRGDA